MRITREKLNRTIVESVALRSSCSRRWVGALITMDNRILATGYNGAPPGMPHCIDVGCLHGPDGGCIRSVHAEANAIAFAARNGVRLEGAHLWCSLTPCRSCSNLIISSGITRVYALNLYRDLSGPELLFQAKVPVLILDGDEFLEWRPNNA